jgi:hypothetical protein
MHVTETHTTHYEFYISLDYRCTVLMRRVDLHGLCINYLQNTYVVNVVGRGLVSTRSIYGSVAAINYRVLHTAHRQCSHQS